MQWVQPAVVMSGYNHTKYGCQVTHPTGFCIFFLPSTDHRFVFLARWTRLLAPIKVSFLQNNCTPSPATAASHVAVLVDSELTQPSHPTRSQNVCSLSQTSSHSLSSNSTEGIIEEKGRQTVLWHSGTLEQPPCNTVKDRRSHEVRSCGIEPGVTTPDAHKHTCSHVQATEHL